MFPHILMLSKKLAKNLLTLAILALLVAGTVWWHNRTHTEQFTLTTKSSSRQKQPTVAAQFDKSKYPIDQAASLWAVVNKGRILASNYAPNVVLPNVPNYYGNASNSSHLRPEAATALEQLFNDATQAGYSLRLVSGYRSYSDQVSTYNGFAKSDGTYKADTYSARPGHSEHQTGLAVDVAPKSGKCQLDPCFGDTPEGKWLAANAYKYGFIIRYQKNTQNLTGYEYEPWHIRFVGIDLAAQINKTGQTLEQFFGLPVYTDYPATSLQLK